MSTLTISDSHRNNKVEFAEQFLTRFLSNGFGTMQKSEVDILVFHLIAENHFLSGATNYEIANELRIPESRVKFLRLNSSLRYKQVNHNEVLRSIVERVIEKNQEHNLDGDYISISLENPVEQRELAYAIKKMGRHIKHTLNSEIFEISLISLFEMVMQSMDDPDHEFKLIINKEIKNAKDQKKLLNNNLSWTDKLKSLESLCGDKVKWVSLLTALSSHLT